MRQRFLPCLICVSLLLAAPLAAAAGTLTINTANDPPNSTQSHAGIADRTVAEACRRLGIGVRLVSLPSERALINVDKGIDDGIYARIAGMQMSYPNLVMVPEPVTAFEFVAVSRQADLPISGWASLEPYDVAFIRGWQLPEVNLKKAKSITKVSDDPLLFRLLVTGRVDVIVYDRRQAEYLIRKNGYTGLHIYEPPIETRDMYLYLNKRHAALVPRIAGAIRQMKKDGTYRRILAGAIKAE